MANDVNCVIVVGNLVRDLSSDERGFSYTKNGSAVAKISIATNRSRKVGDGQYENETSYFDVKIFGKTAENLKPYLTKGKKIAVQGTLKQERWKDQQGNNRSRVCIIAESVQLLGGNQQGTQSNQQNDYSESEGEPFTQDIPF